MYVEVCLEERKLNSSIASFLLMFRNVDAFRYEIISRSRQGRAMRELFDAVEAIIRHLIGRYENGLCLMLTPIVESFIVETFSFVIP